MKTRDGRTIDFERASRAASELMHLCTRYRPDGFTAPEIVQEHIDPCALALNNIGDALCMSKHEATPEVIEALDEMRRVFSATGRDLDTPQLREAAEWLRMMKGRIQ